MTRDYYDILEEQGYKAYHDGSDKYANPYERGTIKHGFWSLGWYKAQDEVQLRKEKSESRTN